MERALTVGNIFSKNYRVIDFQGAWLQAFGTPAATGVWFVWGNSGSGKTSFILQLIKYLSGFDRVFFNSLEEGSGLTLRNGLERNGFIAGDKRVLIGCESREALTERLSARKSPRIVVVDSLQALQMSYREYLRFKEQFAGSKLIVFVSQALGNAPKGAAAVSIYYDADMKIWVEGFRAFSKGRYFGTSEYYTVWAEKSMQYWGVN